MFALQEQILPLGKECFFLRELILCDFHWEVVFY